MKYRDHRELLVDSMKTVRDVETLQDLRDHLGADNVLIEPYCWDRRIGWDTHIVSIGGCACGFTNGPLKEMRGEGRG